MASRTGQRPGGWQRLKGIHADRRRQARVLRREESPWQEQQRGGESRSCAVAMESLGAGSWSAVGADGVPPLFEIAR